MEENREILFARTLEKVRKLAGIQGGRVAGQQVRDAFRELSLSDKQLDMVFDYLKQHKVSVSETAEPDGEWEDIPLKEAFSDGELSGEEVSYLEAYKKQLEGTDEIKDGEKEALTLSAMAGEREARQRLIQLYLPKVVDISRLYAGQGVLLEDLIGEGNVALSMGVTMLGCLENAGEAEGMLMKMVMDAMEESIAENEREREKDKKILSKVNRVAEKAKELSEELRRKITVEELAAETGMSEKAIRDAMRMSGFAIEDLEGR